MPLLLLYSCIVLTHGLAPPYSWFNVTMICVHFRIYLCKQWHLLKTFTGLLFAMMYYSLSIMFLCLLRSLWSGNRRAFWQERIFYSISGNGPQSQVFWRSSQLNSFCCMLHLKHTFALHTTSKQITEKLLLFFTRSCLFV